MHSIEMVVCWNNQKHIYSGEDVCVEQSWRYVKIIRNKSIQVKIMHLAQLVVCWNNKKQIYTTEGEDEKSELANMLLRNSGGNMVIQLPTISWYMLDRLFYPSFTEI